MSEPRRWKYHWWEVKSGERGVRETEVEHSRTGFLELLAQWNSSAFENPETEFVWVYGEVRE